MELGARHACEIECVWDAEIAAEFLGAVGFQDFGRHGFLFGQTSRRRAIQKVRASRNGLLTMEGGTLR
jgi:hypothetical protein